MGFRLLRLAFVFVLPFFYLSARTADSQNNNLRYGKTNKEEIHAYIMLIRLRTDLYSQWKATGKWPDDPNANRALEEHSAYWQRQLQDGRAILAGGMNGDYWDNVALIIFEASSQAEADTMVSNDPAVKAYVFQAQVRPFDVHFLTNKFNVNATVPAPPN